MPKITDIDKDVLMTSLIVGRHGSGSMIIDKLKEIISVVNEQQEQIDGILSYIKLQRKEK